MHADVLLTTSASAASNEHERCPMCGMAKKSGKLSCCARGGAWFQTCGDVGNKQFEHTWVEGVQACNGFAASILGQAPAQVRDALLIQQPINVSGLRNDARDWTDSQVTANTSDAYSVDGEGDVNTAQNVTQLWTNIQPTASVSNTASVQGTNIEATEIALFIINGGLLAGLCL